MQIVDRLMHSTTFHQSGFGKVPEPFDSIDVARTTGELIATMIDLEVFGVALIHQSVIAWSAVAVNDAVEADFTSCKPLKDLFHRIRDNLGVDFPNAFKDAKDNGLASDTSTSFVFAATSYEVGFINLSLSAEGRFGLAKIGNLSRC